MKLNLKSNRPNILSIAITIAALATSLSAPMFADENVDYVLNPVVVSASRLEMPLNQIGSSVQVLQSYDLSIGNEPFLVDALESVSGLAFRNNGGPGNVFGMTTRGLNTNRPIVLIDGIKVSNPANGSILNFGNIFVSGIQRVEVLKGAQSSLYGANAIAGVINIQTSEPGVNPEGVLNVGYGSFNTFEGSLGYSGSTGKLGWIFNTSYYDSDGYSVQNPELGDAWADDDGYENFNFSAHLTYDLNDNAELYLLSYYIDSHAEFDPGNPAWIIGEANDNNYSENSQLFAKSGIKIKFSDEWETQAGIGYGNVDTNSFTGSDYRIEGDRYSFDLQNTVKAMEIWNVVFGLELERATDEIADLERNNVSGFIENVIELTDSLTWTVGGRHDDNSDYGDYSTWRTSFSYNIESMDLRFRGSYGSSFDAPTFYQLFGPYGSDLLKAESGKGWDLGVEKLFSDAGIFISTSLFGYDISDKINFSYGSWKYANEESYESVGVETSVRWEIEKSLSVTLSHTYVDAEYGDGVKAERVPEQVLQLGLNWRGMDDRLQLNLSARYTGEQFGMRGNAQRQANYTIVNVSGKFDISSNLQAWLRISNLFDKDYQEIESYNAPELTIQGGIRLSF